jgi:hypothetical protein
MEFQGKHVTCRDLRDKTDLEAAAAILADKLTSQPAEMLRIAGTLSRYGLEEATVALGKRAMRLRTLEFMAHSFGTDHPEEQTR